MWSLWVSFVLFVEWLSKSMFKSDNLLTVTGKNIEVLMLSAISACLAFNVISSKYRVLFWKVVWLFNQSFMGGACLVISGYLETRAGFMVNGKYFMLNSFRVIFILL